MGMAYGLSITCLLLLLTIYAGREKLNWQLITLTALSIICLAGVYQAEASIPSVVFVGSFIGCLIGFAIAISADNKEVKNSLEEEIESVTGYANAYHMYMQRAHYHADKGDNETAIMLLNKAHEIRRGRYHIHGEEDEDDL